MARTRRLWFLLVFVLYFCGAAEAQPCTTVQLCIARDGSGSISPTTPPTCSIDPPTATNPFGEQHSMTVTVRKADGSVAPNVEVTVEVTAGPNAPASGTFNTGTSGQVDVFYTGNGGEGTDTIEARGIIDGAPFSCTAMKTWTAPQPRCAIAPQSDTNPVDTQHQFTVRVTFAGTPQPGVGMTMSIASGPNSPDSRVATTDANGEIDVFYTGDGGPGTDTIRASGTINGIDFSCMATKTWVLPPPACNITPSSDTNPVGTRHDMDVTVTRGSVPQSGVGVAVDITSGPNSPSNRTLVTGPNGQVGVSYTSNGQPGMDTITASGFVGGIAFSCNATKVWVAPTSTPSRSPTITPTATPSASPTPDVDPCACVGDCNCAGQVTIDEIVTMVNVAIGSSDVGTCPAGDPSGDLAVTVDEILTAISNALDGCG